MSTVSKETDIQNKTPLSGSRINIKANQMNGVNEINLIQIQGNRSYIQYLQNYLSETGIYPTSKNKWTQQMHFQWLSGFISLNAMDLNTQLNPISK